MELLKKITFWLIFILAVSMFPLWLIPFIAMFFIIDEWGSTLNDNNVVDFAYTIGDEGWFVGILLFTMGNGLSALLSIVVYLICGHLLGAAAVNTVAEIEQGELLLTWVDAEFRFLILLGFWFLVYKVIKPFVVQFMYKFLVKDGYLDYISGNFVFTRNSEKYTEDLNAVDTISHLLGIMMVIQLIILLFIAYVSTESFIPFMYVQSPMLIFILLFSLACIVLFFVLMGEAIHHFTDKLPKNKNGDKRSLKKSLFKLFF